MYRTMMPSVMYYRINLSHGLAGRHDGSTTLYLISYRISVHENCGIESQPRVCALGLQPS